MVCRVLPSFHLAKCLRQPHYMHSGFSSFIRDLGSKEVAKVIAEDETIEFECAKVTWRENEVLAKRSAAFSGRIRQFARCHKSTFQLIKP